jgi:hypothetical protein
VSVVFASSEKSATVPWRNGLIAGGVAGVGMGVVLHFQLFILPLFGSLYGRPGVSGGAALHLAVSLAFGLGFAVLVRRTPLRQITESTRGIVLTAVSYGLFIWFAVGTIVFPIVTLFTPPRALPIPYLSIDWLLSHVVYGALLGVTFALSAPREDD